MDSTCWEHALGVSRYVGRTNKSERTLKDRLFGRYIGGPASQCQLAADYEQQLVAHGLAGFPPGIGTSRVRRKGAVDFAEHGIQGIWATILPISQ